jgi:membrane-bound lytic murein transglycosylase D
VQRARSLLVAAALAAGLPAWHGATAARAQVPPRALADLVPGDESEELRALRLAELELFAGPSGQALVDGALPEALTSAVMPEASLPAAGSTADVAMLRGLALPDLPVRWDARVVDYLRFFRDDPRGRGIVRGWMRRAPRHERAIREVLRRRGLPEDLFYVAMVESGLDPTARSHAGAVGMWQFVAGTGDEYGLARSHWIDERMSPEASTDAAARYLSDLHRRFGSWELALAAYNMGYGALLRAIRKYNTNDFWALARVEAGLPFETTLYVAKILACAVIGRNPGAFGLDGLEREVEPALARIEVPGGIPLAVLARAAGTDAAALARWNPELRRGRTPPGQPFALRVPAAGADAFVRQLARLRQRTPPERAYVVRFGETLDDVAARFGTTAAALARTNELGERDVVRAGFTLLVPDVAPRPPRESEPPVVTVPDRRFSYPGRRRVFYRVVEGDTAADVARAFGVTLDELRRWNDVDSDALLQRGMFLQLFVPDGRDLGDVVALGERDVRVLVAGSDEFFDHHEAQRGRVRTRYVVAEGDTLASIARRFDLSPASIARINRFDRQRALAPGEEITVYAPRPGASGAGASRASGGRATSAAAEPVAASETAARPDRGPHGPGAGAGPPAPDAPAPDPPTSDGPGADAPASEGPASGARPGEPEAPAGEGSASGVTPEDALR